MKKPPTGIGCLIALLYFPLGVILELARDYGAGPRRRYRRRR